MSVVGWIVTTLALFLAVRALYELFKIRDAIEANGKDAQRCVEALERELRFESKRIVEACESLEAGIRDLAAAVNSN